MLSHRHTTFRKSSATGGTTNVPSIDHTGSFLISDQPQNQNTTTDNTKVKENGRSNSLRRSVGRLFIRRLVTAVCAMTVFWGTTISLRLRYHPVPLSASTSTSTSWTTTNPNDDPRRPLDLGGGGDGVDGQRDTNTTITITTGKRTPNSREPTHHACDGYRGIYHIAMGDIGGAAGTIFFQFVLGQIMWAEQYGFKPWVYLNNVSNIVYDPIVHGQGSPGIDFTMLKGMEISFQRRPHSHRREIYPGPPLKKSLDNLHPFHFHFDGDGVWEHYFEPVSDFVPGDKSCENKPLVTMPLVLITPGVHGFAPWAPRGWRYQYLPDYITRPHIPLNDWLEPMRRNTHQVSQRYIRFQPHLARQAHAVNPDCAMDRLHACLGLHIRQSDKAAGRRQITTDEFLPYVESFLNAGGKWVYLATDSGNVMKHIQTNWPDHVNRVLRSMGDDIVRSNDFQAVFDLGEHHRTNTEILIEIAALAQCQFMIHGLSAVTESSIWINLELHYTSVNLEDPEHVNATYFGEFVDKVLNGGENATKVALDHRPVDWWTTHRAETLTPSDKACTGDVEGILHIASAGTAVGAPTAFFQSIVNQLLYAERNPKLKPWVMLSDQSELLFDATVHGSGQEIVESVSNELTISVMRHDSNESFFYPGPPVKRLDPSRLPREVRIEGNGIWLSYFRPVSDFIPGDTSCLGKPIVEMSAEMVNSLNAWSPWSVKAWQYDSIPDKLWKSHGTTLKAWLQPMRVKGNKVVKKYFQFHPFIVKRAEEVNPTNSTTLPCLAVHLQNGEKAGHHRNRFPPNKLRDYFLAFARAGGQTIYVASDKSSTLEYINEHFPVGIRQMIRTAGPYVVRAGFWPIHKLEPPHRTTSEVLVDILAMSKCQLLLHGHSAVSEAAIYLNLNLHNQSVNWEDPDRMSADEFEQVTKKVLGTSGTTPVDLTVESEEEPTANATIVAGSPTRTCRRNAIVYLAQKKHSSYGRDSYGILLQSLELMNRNYLARGTNRENTDVIIFHTADFTTEDLKDMEAQLGPDFRDALYFVDLFNTTYWKRPSWHKNDNPLDAWYAFPLFSEGYRRMMHWFAIDIWRFFQDYNRDAGCQYEYIMRFDEDSFLHSPIDYDIFDFMKTNDFNYGFRLCAYEMQVTRRIWKLWRSAKVSTAPIRDIDLEMCGFYNNFFVARLSFFQDESVQKFLRFVDRQGMIYRRRLGDLMIHSMAVYGHSPQEKIHRFLDFTYEHGTLDKKTGCLMWGGIQAGYNDPNATTTLDSFHRKHVIDKECALNVTFPTELDLSPTYQHLPSQLDGKVKLQTVMAGKVELPNKGMLSG